MPQNYNKVSLRQKSEPFWVYKLFFIPEIKQCVSHERDGGTLWSLIGIYWWGFSLKSRFAFGSGCFKKYINIYRDNKIYYTIRYFVPKLFFYILFLSNKSNLKPEMEI